MATSKSIIASPVLLFAAMAALMLAAVLRTEAAAAPAPAPAHGSNSCPAGFKNYLDLTDFASHFVRGALVIVDPNLLPIFRSIISLVPHTGLQFCVCFQTNNASSILPIGCIAL